MTDLMTDQQRKRREPFVGLFVLVMGILTFSNVASRPSFATYRAVDVLGLMTSGMCVGAAMIVLIRFLRGRAR